MKLLWEWLLKNSWNLFSVLGVLATFYFSLQVPDYVEKVAIGKNNVIHESLMDDIQEILFYDKKLSIEDINLFIKGKELKREVVYIYTADELLMQVQERFMGNKFIPLEKREALLQSIKEVRSTYTPPKNETTKEFEWKIIFTWLLSGVFIFIGITGIRSIYNKMKVDKETEIDITSMNTSGESNESGNKFLAAIEFEKMVGDILKDLNINKTIEKSSRDRGYDFEAYDGKYGYIVEVKMYNSLLGLNTAREFLYKVNQSGKGGILVTLSGVTKRTKELIEQHNKVSENQKVYLITGESKNSIKNQFTKIFT